MVWLKAEYEVGSLLSYRIPDYPSPSYALCSPLLGPSAIKLAIVATAIETTRDLDFGEEIFGLIKNAKIKIKIPKKIAISNLLIKRLKQIDPKIKTKLIGTCSQCGKTNNRLWDVDGAHLCKKCATKLSFTYGIRGYLHLPESFVMFIEVPEKNKELLKDILKRVRYLGTSDSLVYCLKIQEEEPLSNCIEPTKMLEKVERNILLIPTKDLNSNKNIKFKDINPYSSKKRDVLVKKFYLLPISKKTEGKNWIIYETSD
ncbi:MAG: hypothetical protein QXL17_06515 [Candidatus Thermoplasmatota archaeon]